MLLAGRVKVKDQNKLKLLIHVGPFWDIWYIKYDGKKLTRTFTLYLHKYNLGLKSKERKSWIC